jgi:cell division protein FtsN
VPQRTAEQDAAEVERNKNWDPNSPLFGKNPARPGAMPPPPGPSASAAEAAGAGAPAAAALPAPGAAAEATARRSPADILNDRPAPATAAASAGDGPDPFSYFVQVGAFARPEDAEQQRARLAMLGFAARVTERAQVGRTVYRVRVGPFDRKEDADVAKDKLDGSGMESSLVRVQRQ